LQPTFHETGDDWGEGAAVAGLMAVQYEQIASDVRKLMGNARPDAEGLR
jgi:hypothetical protein